GKGAKLLPVNVNPNDMQYIEIAGLTGDDLMVIFGFPSGYFSDKANRANAAQAERTFVARTAQPEADENADQMGDALRRAFNAPPESGLVIQAADIVPSDPDFDLRRDESYLRTGVYTINHIKEREGMDTV